MEPTATSEASRLLVASFKLLRGVFSPRAGNAVPSAVDSAEGAGNDIPGRVAALPSGHPAAAASSGGRRRPALWAAAAVSFLNVLVVLILLVFSFKPQKVALLPHEEHLVPAMSWLTHSIEFLSEGFVEESSNDGPMLERGSARSKKKHHDTPPRLYALSSKPPTQWDLYERGGTELVIPRQGYLSWHLWLTPGSTVEVSAHFPASVNLTFLAVRGTAALKLWTHKDGPKEGDIIQRLPCSGGAFTTRFAADVGDHFELGFANSQSHPVVCNVSVHVSTEDYDLTRSDPICLLDVAQSCSPQLPLFASESLLIARPEAKNPEGIWDVTLKYAPRWSILLLFAGAPFGVLAVLSLLTLVSAFSLNSVPSAASLFTPHSSVGNPSTASTPLLTDSPHHQEENQGLPCSTSFKECDPSSRAAAAASASDDFGPSYPGSSSCSSTHRVEAHGVEDLEAGVGCASLKHVGEQGSCGLVFDEAERIRADWNKKG